MWCPVCSAVNPEQARFCLKCGAKLVRACAACGTELPLDADFCFSCGKAISTESPDPLADVLKRLAPKEYAERLLAAHGQVGHERRSVTILFSDIKGSSAMASTLDPEEVLEIINGAFEFLIAPVFRYEGTLTQLMGDAILAFFGAPIAHDDDPERACRAALDIVAGARDYAARLQRERGISGFNVRVGINTGPVVVGEIGTDLRVAYTAVGDTINMAARMEQCAEPGTVLVTEDTCRLVAPLFDIRDMGQIEVKGHKEPMSVYRVLAPKAVGKVRGITGLASPLVGRDRELGELREAMGQLAAGVGGIVTVVGEAGIGKSRLVAEARKGGDASRVQWVEGRCLSYGTSIAYLLWLDVLRGLVGVTEDASSAAVRTRLRTLAQAFCPEKFDQVYPYLARLMSLPSETELEVALGEVEGEQLRIGTFGAVESLVECSARERPLVLVCEDLHWADPTSLQLLERVLGLVDRVALLVLCVFRPDPARGCWRLKETAARTYPHRHTDVRLGPLSVQESGTLLANLMGTGLQKNPLGVRILQQAEGNPFYVEEILRSLLKDGAFHRGQEGTWQAARNLDHVAIPETLQGVIMSRIDGLSEGSRRVLQLAAVIGRIVPKRLLAAIAQGTEQIEGHLITLQREGMIRERSRVPEWEYIFKHELIREATYDSVLKKERRVLHRKVAEALEQIHSDRIEEYVEILAEHWDAADDPDKSMVYLAKAGDHARRFGASMEAIGFYDRALVRAVALQPLRREDLRRLHESLGDVYLLNLSRHDEALAHYTAFLSLADSDEESAKAGRKMAVLHQLRGHLADAEECYQSALARLGSRSHSEEASAIHCGLAYLFWAQNRLEEAAVHGARGLQIAEEIGGTRVLADAHRAAATIAYARGDFETACAHLEQTLRLYRETGDLPRTAQTCNNVAETYRILGKMARAVEHLDAGLELARRIGDTRDEAHLLGTRAELFMDQGRWEDALALLERALPLAEESGVAPGIIEVELFLGLALTGVGRLDDAWQHLEVARRLSQDAHYARYDPHIYLGMAEVQIEQCDFAEARRLSDLAEEAAGANPPVDFRGLAYSCRAHLLAGEGKFDRAITDYERSVDFLRQANLQAEMGKAYLNLGMACASRDREGDRGRAREHLLAARSIFQKIEAGGYLACVEVELEKVCSIA